VIVSAYAAACTRRTRLVVIDRITSPTATVIPVAAVAAAAVGVDTSVLVDAALPAHRSGTVQHPR
jgi:isopenicillin-N epimerase